jgi:hypothetical protein
LVVCLFILYLLPHQLVADEWNIVTKPNDPNARFGHRLVTLPDGKVLMFGGKNEAGDVFNDLSIFDGSEWNAIQPSGSKPEPRFGFSIELVVLIEDKDKWLLFGGKDPIGDLFDSLVSFDGDDWDPVTPNNDPPPARAWHSSWTNNGTLYVAGGVGESGNPMSDIWSYDTATNQWTEKTRCPGSLKGAFVAVYDGKAHFLGSSALVLSYDMAQDEWSDTFPTGDRPPWRDFAAGVQYDSKAIICGGEGSVLKDTWEYDFIIQTWTQKADMPVALMKASAAMIGNQMVLFGGLKEDGSVSGDTYLYTLDNTGIVDDITLPETYSLFQNYPNPFNPETTIKYNLNKPGHVNLIIYDIHGKLIKTLVNENHNAGTYEVHFDGHQLASGVYFYRISTQSFSEVKKMLLLE